VLVLACPPGPLPEKIDPSRLAAAAKQQIPMLEPPMVKLFAVEAKAGDAGTAARHLSGFSHLIDGGPINT
jgi:hypothetical protein